MANTLNAFRNRAVGFIDWLDRDVVINRFAAVRTKLKIGRYREGSAALLKHSSDRTLAMHTSSTGQHVNDGSAE